MTNLNYSTCTVALVNLWMVGGKELRFCRPLNFGVCGKVFQCKCLRLSSCVGFDGKVYILVTYIGFQLDIFERQDDLQLNSRKTLSYFTSSGI